MIGQALRTIADVALIAAALLAAPAAAAEPAAEFYAGQELTILIGHPPGGSGGAAIGRALISPPDRLAALRAAFDAVVRDPALRAEAKRRNLYVEPTPGADVQAYGDAIVKTPKDIVDIAAKAFNAP
jgi:hypothetical protein